jgi:hypothetical protein
MNRTLTIVPPAAHKEALLPALVLNPFQGKIQPGGVRPHSEWEAEDVCILWCRRALLRAEAMSPWEADTPYWHVCVRALSLSECRMPVCIKCTCG